MRTIWIVAALAACGGKDEGTTTGAACDPFVGTVFTLDEGAGTVRGTLTFPADVEDGRQVEIMLGDGIGWYGMLAEDVFATPETCGGPIDYEITNLDAGTYELRARVLGDGTDEVLAEGLVSFDSADDVVEGLDVALE